MDSQIVRQLLEITKVFTDKGSTFMIDIAIENNIFKIINQNKKGVEIPKQQWRKTPSQLQRDIERQQTFFAEKRKAELGELSDVTLVNDNKENNQAHKIILTGTRQDIKKKDIGINTDMTKTTIEKKHVETNTDKEPNQMPNTRPLKTTKDKLSEVHQNKAKANKDLILEEKQREEEKRKREKEKERLYLDRIIDSYLP